MNEVSFLQNFHPEMLIVIVALPSSNPHDLRKKNILPKSKKPYIKTTMSTIYPTTKMFTSLLHNYGLSQNR